MYWHVAHAAQVAQVTDPISGGAGWVGAGLLGLVLGWLLLFHLPAKDKQIKEFSEAKDKHVGEVLASTERRLDLIANTFREESKETRKEFRDSLEFIMGQLEKHTNSVIAAMHEEFQKLNNGGKK